MQGPPRRASRLRPGRAALATAALITVAVFEGRDLHESLEMVRTANDSNTAIHVLDPRGLMASGMQTSLLDTLAREAGATSIEPTTWMRPFIIEARSGDDRAEAIVPLRIKR